jgi:hypothetical protein
MPLILATRADLGRERDLGREVRGQRSDKDSELLSDL